MPFYILSDCVFTSKKTALLTPQDIIAPTTLQGEAASIVITTTALVQQGMAKVKYNVASQGQLIVYVTLPTLRLAWQRKCYLRTT